MKKRLLSGLLAAVMLLSLGSVTVFADGDSGTVTYDNNTDGEGLAGATEFDAFGNNKTTVDEYYTLAKAAGTDDGTLDYYVTVEWTRTLGTGIIKGDTYHWDASKQMYERTTVENSLTSNTAATVDITVKNYSNAKVTYDISYETATDYDTTEAAENGYSKNGTLANYITYDQTDGSTIAGEGIENHDSDNNTTKDKETGKESYKHEHTAPFATYKGTVTLNANAKTKAAFTNQKVGTYTINIKAAAIAKQTVSATVDTTKDNTVLTATPNPAEDNTKSTEVKVPNTVAALENGSTAKLTATATGAEDAIGSTSFKIADSANNALGAIDLTLTVTKTDSTSGAITTETVNNFKDSLGYDVPVTVTTYVAKLITKFNFSYNGTAFTPVENESDVDAANEVWYDPATGKLVFCTTHFSTFVIDGDNTIYDPAANTVYKLSDDGTKILDATVKDASSDDADKTEAAGKSLTLLDCSLSNKISDDLASGKTWTVIHSDCSNVDDGCWHAENKTDFASGYGTKVEPYIVKNATQFQNITGKNDKYAYYKAEATEIDCTDLKGVELNGSFDGNGVTFKNLNNDTGIFFRVMTTTKGTDNEYVTCKVGNFTADASCKMTRTYGASIIREIQTNAELYNITSYATITGTLHHSSGLVGYTNNDNKININNEEQLFQNCKTLLIKDCTVNSTIYHTNTSEVICGAFVGFPMNDTAVTIEDCKFGGKICTPVGKSSGASYYAGQTQANLTVKENGNTLDQSAWKTLTLNKDLFEIFMINPVAVASGENTGYTFNKAEGAVNAKVIFEVRGKMGATEGCNFVVFNNDQDISEKTAGDCVKIDGLNYMTDLTMVRGDSVSCSFDGSVCNITHPTYDENWLSLPYIFVVQYDANGNVVATGALYLSDVTLPQDQPV